MKFQILIRSIFIIFIICILFYTYKFFYNTEFFTTHNNKILCLYAYYEKNDLYKNNLQYFLNNGILDNIDYYFIINGKSTINIPNKPNIHVINRENKGYDFGAYSHTITNHITTKYDYYVFMNASVSGPHISPQYKNKKWFELFLELFNDASNIKLVGTSINIYDIDTYNSTDLRTLYGNKPVFVHVQSMFFILDSDGFNYLHNIGFFSDEQELNTKENINDVILYKEFGLSQHILNNNWNINCILSKYRGID